VILKAKTSPLGRFVILLLIGLVWNGIVGVFLFQVIQMWSRGGGGPVKWFLTVFLIPFFGVGVLLLGLLVHSFLGLFNPRPRLRVSASGVPPGGTIDLSWHFTGRSRRIRQLRLFLEGREEATYRRGTRTSTDKSVFATVEVAKLTNPADVRAGTAKVTVPAGAMHSFASANNKILWSLHLKADIPNMPDLDEEFPITVQPAEH
jgi:hypothetical protein